MRRLLLTLCVLAVASSVCAQTITVPTFVSRNTGQSGASLVSATQTHSAGNLLVAMLFHQANTATATGCTNTAGDTWAPTRATAYNQSLGGTSRTVEIWYTATASSAASPATGTIGATNDIVTCTINAGNTYDTIDVGEAHKTSGTWGFVADAVGTAASGATSFTTTSLTLTNPSVIFGQMMLSSSGTVTPGTGYTLGPGAGGADGGSFSWTEQHITSVSEAATATGSSTGYVFIAAAFQASVASGNSATLLIRDPQ